MSTWHQSRNTAGMKALWEPHETMWKCVSDKPGQLASAMSFAYEDAARSFAERYGDVLVPPKTAQKGPSS